jgi:hypothetical protein
MRTSSLDRCVKCNANLAVRKKPLSRKAISASWQDIGLDVVHLFGQLANRNFSEIPERGVQDSLNDIFDFYWGNPPIFNGVQK